MSDVKKLKKKLAFNNVLLHGKHVDNVPSDKIKRFPRLPSKDEVANKETITTIETKCMEFACPGRIVAVKVGPVVTQFDFQPERFVRMKRLRAVHEDLAMALSRDNVTVTRLPGEAQVAIMVPNAIRKMPTFQQTLANYLPFRKTMDLPMNLGVDSLGNPVVIDLCQSPHVLIAGETGAGKSVLLNSIINSLLYAKTPKQLKFMLVDSKAVELTGYRDLPHTDSIALDIWDALKSLQKAEQEMRRRMAFINLKGCKNLKELNAKLEPQERLPYIVIVIDEMADLVLQEKKQFTTQMAIIAGMARAAGVHVIAATQRPSVDVLSGKIKVNFPTRIAFHMPSAGDSKTVLNQKGAEQLSAKGDAFAILPGRSGLVRLHTPHCTEDDIKKMIRASIAVGQKNAPADISAKDLERIEKELAAAQKIQAAKANVSLADELEGEKGAEKVQ